MHNGDRMSLFHDIWAEGCNHLKTPVVDISQMLIQKLASPHQEEESIFPPLEAVQDLVTTSTDQNMAKVTLCNF